MAHEFFKKFGSRGPVGGDLRQPSSPLFSTYTNSRLSGQMRPGTKYTFQRSKEKEEEKGVFKIDTVKEEERDEFIRIHEYRRDPGRPLLD